MRVIQIPFSHNCVKVRLALERKGLPYDTLDIAPMERDAVQQSSGQRLVPALEDGDQRIADSTAILRYLEETYPEPSLLPRDPSKHAACWLLEDWADRAFMEMTRRIAYWQVVTTPGTIERLFFPEASGLKRRMMVRIAVKAVTKRFRLSAERNAKDEEEAPRMARLALDRLAGRPTFFSDGETVADLTLATMAAPMIAASDHLLRDPAIDELLAWVRPIVGEKVLELYSRNVGL